MTGLGKALVIEENGLIAMDTCEALLEAGFAAAVATSFEQALDDIQAGPVDFVLLDTDLTSDKSEMLLAAIRMQSIPLAFSTSQPDGGDIPAAWQSAAFIAKPYTARDLKGVLAQQFPDHIFAALPGAAPCLRQGAAPDQADMVRFSNRSRCQSALPN